MATQILRMDGQTVVNLTSQLSLDDDVRYLLQVISGGDRLILWDLATAPDAGDNGHILPVGMGLTATIQSVSGQAIYAMAPNQTGAVIAVTEAA